MRIHRRLVDKLLTKQNHLSVTLLEEHKIFKLRCTSQVFTLHSHKLINTTVGFSHCGFS